MELFSKIGEGYKPLTMFAKWFTLDIWQGSEYASEFSNILGTYSVFLVRLFIFSFDIQITRSLVIFRILYQEW